MWERLSVRLHRTEWLGQLAITAAVTVVTVGVTAAAPNQAGQRQVDLRALGLLLCASLAVGASRWFPRASFVVSLLGVGAYQALGYPFQSPYFLPLLFTGYAAGLPARRLQTAGQALLAIAVLAAAGLQAGNIQAGLFIPVLVLTALMAGELTGEVRAAESRRREQARRREAELLVTEERLRIARELHDVVSHSIAMIGVQAGVAAHLLKRDPEQARQALVAIKTASRDALRDLRGSLGVLRQVEEPESRAPAAGLASLPELVDGIRRAGVEVAVSTVGAPEPLSPATDLAAYRIVQEALTNVIRHAPGARATVELHYADGRLQIAVRNRGVGQRAEPAPGAGHGLTGLKERAAAAGGAISAGPEPGGGYAVRAWLPLAEGRVR